MWNYGSKRSASNPGQQTLPKSNESFYVRQKLSSAHFMRLDSTGNAIENIPDSNMPPNLSVERQLNRNMNYHKQLSDGHLSDKRSHWRIFRTTSDPVPTYFVRNYKHSNSDSFIEKFNNCYSMASPSPAKRNTFHVKTTLPAVLGPLWWQWSVADKLLAARDGGNDRFTKDKVNQPEHFGALSAAVFGQMQNLLNMPSGEFTVTDGGNSPMMANCESPNCDRAPPLVSCETETDVEKSTGTCKSSRNSVEKLDCASEADCLTVKATCTNIVIPNNVPPSKDSGHPGKRCRKKPRLDKTDTDLYDKKLMCNKRTKEKQCDRRSKQKQKNVQKSKKIQDCYPNKGETSANDCVTGRGKDRGKWGSKSYNRNENNVNDGKRSRKGESESRSQQNTKKSKLKHLNREPKYFVQCNNFVDASEDVSGFPQLDVTLGTDSPGNIRQKLREGYIQSIQEQPSKNNGKYERETIHSSCNNFGSEKKGCNDDDSNAFNSQREDSGQCRDEVEDGGCDATESNILDLPRAFSLAVSFSDVESDWDESDCGNTDQSNGCDSDLACFMQLDDVFNVACRVVVPGCETRSPDSCDSDDSDESDMSASVKAANLAWDDLPQGRRDEDTAKGKDGRHKNVHFAPDCSLAHTHMMIAWRYAYAAARPGPWEQYARDRERFQGRISRCHDIISPVMSTDHRTAVFNRLYGGMP